MSLKKYIVDSKMFEYDKHYRDCVHNRQPFIKARVNPASRNYIVQVDLMPCKYNLSKEGIQYMRKLFDREIDLLKSSSLNPFFDYSLDEGLCWIDGVTSARLDDFCQTLYSLVQQYHD